MRVGLLLLPCHRAVLCPSQVEWGHADDPHISPNMYDLAISLIQSFDEVEAGDHR